METTNKTTTSEPKPNPQGNLGGFDLNGLLNNASLMELLKHLLSGGAAMAGNYFMWIKPMQDKMEAMSKQIMEQEKQIEELEDEQEKIIARLEQDKETASGTRINPDEYFTIRKSRPSAMSGKRPLTRM